MVLFVLSHMLPSLTSQYVGYIPFPFPFPFPWLYTTQSQFGPYSMCFTLHKLHYAKCAAPSSEQYLHFSVFRLSLTQISSLLEFRATVHYHYRLNIRYLTCVSFTSYQTTRYPAITFYTALTRRHFT
jgi:hypothetical protein